MPRRLPPPRRQLPLEEWKTWTIAEYLAEVQTAARAFVGLGLVPKDAVAIYGFNAPEWIMGKLRTFCCLVRACYGR